MIEQTIFLFLIAVVFTIVGYRWGQRSVSLNLINLTVDTLLKAGYLKTKGKGDDLEILKWDQPRNAKDNSSNK